MARITSEAVALKIGNIYDMSLIAAARAREIKRGKISMLGDKNKPIVTAIREVEQGMIGKEYLRKLRTNATPKRK